VSADAVPEMAAIQVDVERTRAQLGATVDELSQRLDVKTRAKQQVDQVKARLRAQARRRNVQLAAAATAVAGAFVVVRVRRGG
jgi:hypothetical protein